MSEDCREVAFHIAGYIEKKNPKRFGKCCHKLMIGVDKYDSPDKKNIEILSRGGLTIPSTNYVCGTFAILDFTFDVINN